MTTPAQRVPDDFQDTLDLPQASVDPAAARRARQGLDKAKAGSRRATHDLKMAQDRVQALKRQAARRGLSEAQRKRLERSIGEAERVAKAQQKAVDTATAGIKTAQRTVYETTGQYDKLLSGSNRDAFLALKSLFNGYGLGSLAGRIYDYVKQGYGADTISLLLQDTKEYKTRFAGNEARIKAGLPVLSPADYLATESAYRQVLSSAGLPKGFYDNPADFTRWISADVSPTEIKDRVDLATQAVAQSNPAYRQALFKMYGIQESDLTAYFLDRKVAEPILKKQAAAAAIGAAAIRRGFAANKLDLEGYATMGVTADQAEQVYGQIADSMDTMLNIAGRFGSVWNQRLAEQEAFTPGAVSAPGQESASALGKRLRSQERAMFSGGQGSSVAGLNPGYSQT
ncbi:hypothetical protein AB0E62_00380 [Streptomyces sp. NPDC038707]|uniref:hypothetical protein n=1 Tax=Streptomyces sp. NPDC038707 TaxID=3154329 RepID=UPI0033C13F03